MSAPNLTNLMLSIAAAIAADAGCTLGTDLFVGGSPASGAAAYSVFNLLAGPQPGELYRVPEISSQLMAIAASSATALDQANRIYESLHTPGTPGSGLGSRPRSMWSVPGQRVNAAGVIEADPAVAIWDVRLLVLRNTPGTLGRDKDGLWRAAFNFDVYFTAP